MKEKVSIYKIAELTGFSHTTVSLCLNKTKGYERVSQKTRDKINKVAIECNYQKNNYASSLRTQSSILICLIVPSLTNRFFGQLSENFQKIALNLGLFPVISACNYNYNLEKKAVSNFISNNASAIFLGASSSPNKLMAMCRKNNIFSIAMDNVSELGVSITSTNEESSEKLTNILLNKSMKNEKLILFIGGPKTSYTKMERLKGFRKSLKNNNITRGNYDVVETEYNQDDAFNVMKDLITSNKLTANIVYFNSLVVLEGGLNAIKKYSNINDYIIGSYDYHPFLTISNFNIVSVEQNAEKIMEAGFKLLKEYQTTKEFQNLVLKLPTMMIENKI